MVGAEELKNGSEEEEKEVDSNSNGGVDEFHACTLTLGKRHLNARYQTEKLNILYRFYIIGPDNFGRRTILTMPTVL